MSSPRRSEGRNSPRNAVDAASALPRSSQGDEASRAKAEQASPRETSRPTASPRSDRLASPRVPSLVLPPHDERQRSQTTIPKPLNVKLPPPPVIALHMQSSAASRSSAGTPIAALPPPTSKVVRSPLAGEGSPRGNEATASAPPTGDSSIPRSGSADVTRGQRSASTRPTNWSRAAPPSADDLVRKAVLTAAENATGKKEPDAASAPAVASHPMSDTLLKMSAAGLTQKMREMLSSGAAVFDKCVDKDGNTAAHVAARYGKLDVLQMLREQGCALGTPSRLGNTALHYAASKGHAHIVRWLFGVAKLDIDCVNSSGATPLHVAAENGQIDVMEMLLLSGAAIEHVSKLGSTPLQMAAEKGHLAAVKFLIERGAQHLHRNSDGMRAVHRAARGGHTNVVRFLLSLPNCTVDDPNALGNTALHLAAAENRLPLVEVLLEELNARVDCTNQDMWTPLHYAAEAGHVDVAKLLLAHGANGNACTTYNSTPLHWASEGGHLDMARLLISEAGASIEALDKDSSTPLHLAAEKGYHKLVLVYVREYGGKLDDRAKQAMLTVAERSLPSAEAEKVGEAAPRSVSQSMASPPAAAVAATSASVKDEMRALNVLWLDDKPQGQHVEVMSLWTKQAPTVFMKPLLSLDALKAWLSLNAMEVQAKGEQAFRIIVNLYREKDDAALEIAEALGQWLRRKSIVPRVALLIYCASTKPLEHLLKDNSVTFLTTDLRVCQRFATSSADPKTLCASPTQTSMGQS